MQLGCKKSLLTWLVGFILVISAYDIILSPYITLAGEYLGLILIFPMEYILQNYTLDKVLKNEIKCLFELQVPQRE